MGKGLHRRIDSRPDPAPDLAQTKREREKAKALRQSAWWKSCTAKGKCHYCGGDFPPGELTMDHVIPVARGGKSEKGNVVPCCKACNTKKKALTPAEILLESLGLGGECDEPDGY